MSVTSPSSVTVNRSAACARRCDGRPRTVAARSGGLAVTKQRADPLTGDTEEPGYPLHRQTLAVESLRLSAAELATHGGQLVENGRDRLNDERALLVTDDLTPGLALGAAGQDLLH